MEEGCIGIKERVMQSVVIALLVLLFFPAQALSASGSVGGSGADVPEAVRIRILFDARADVVVRLLDSPASKDFLTLLPLSLPFSDFAGAEKIASLPRKLTTRGSPTAQAVSGDFTYYAPWGNLAVFYKGVGSDSRLYVLGTIESGKDSLAGIPHNAKGRIERVR